MVSVTCGFELAGYFRLILVDHHTADHRRFAGEVIIDMDESARFDYALVDLSVGFIHVTNALVEHVTKSIVRAFRADYNYLAWL